MNTADLTLGYYNEKAESFAEGTRNVDFSVLKNKVLVISNSYKSKKHTCEAYLEE